MPDTQTIPQIDVPGQRVALEPPSPARVRALKRHLIESLRDLAAARRPERLVQKRQPEPGGQTAEVLRQACAHCAGSCCMAGGTHAFIDERTLARVHAEQPTLTARALLGAYVTSVAPLSYRGSCLFHGPLGCSLDRPLRAELCNAYYCNGLQTYLDHPAPPGSVVRVVTHAGDERLIAPVPIRVEPM
jgi:hypothetical protein